MIHLIMGAREPANDRPGFGLVAVSTNCDHTTIKRFSEYMKYFKNFPTESCRNLRFLKIDPTFECREWSFVLFPGRSTRLFCHGYCFKTWINPYISIALKFMRLFAFSRPRYDLPLRGSRLRSVPNPISALLLAPDAKIA